MTSPGPRVTRKVTAPARAAAHLRARRAGTFVEVRRRMRKQAKKSLSLSTQTLRSLTDDVLAPAAGAGFKTITLVINCTKPNPTVVNCL